MKIIDITQELLVCKVYPGDPKPQVQSLSSMKNGDLYNLSALSFCAHNGTHVDAPAHFLKDGKTIDQLPLGSFVGDCVVLHHNGMVTGQDAVAMLETMKNYGTTERLLIAGNAVVTAEAARVFAASDLKLVGNESQSVGPEEAPMEVHLILLQREIVLLEGIVLDGVKEGRYFLSAAPLNAVGLEGAPCRAYLIER